MREGGEVKWRQLHSIACVAAAVVQDETAASKSGRVMDRQDNDGIVKDDTGLPTLPGRLRRASATSSSSNEAGKPVIATTTKASSVVSIATIVKGLIQSS